MIESGQFAHRAVKGDTQPRTDWLVYKHWDPANGRYGPVRDFYAYNGGDLRADNDVADLGMEGSLVRQRGRRCDLGGQLGRAPINLSLKIPVGRRRIDRAVAKQPAEELLENMSEPV